MESESIMLKKTVAGAALMAAAFAMSAAPAHAVTGAADVKAHVGDAAKHVQYYWYGYPVYRRYYRPYAYRGWAYGTPYAYGYYPGYYSYGWGYPTGYWGGYGWSPGVGVIAPGVGIGFGF